MIVLVLMFNGFKNALMRPQCCTTSTAPCTLEMIRFFYRQEIRDRNINGKRRLNWCAFESNTDPRASPNHPSPPPLAHTRIYMSCVRLRRLPAFCARRLKQRVKGIVPKCCKSKKADEFYGIGAYTGVNMASAGRLGLSKMMELARRTDHSERASHVDAATPR